MFFIYYLYLIYFKFTNKKCFGEKGKKVKHVELIFHPPLKLYLKQGRVQNLFIRGRYIFDGVKMGNIRLPSLIFYPEGSTYPMPYALHEIFFIKGRNKLLRILSGAYAPYSPTLDTPLT